MTTLMYARFVLDNVKLVFFAFWVLLIRLYRIIVRQPLKALKGEIILVTGGSSGIGRAICKELVGREPLVTIIVWNVNPARNKAVIKELEALGIQKAVGYIVDVSDREQVKRAAERVRNEIGNVTMLFNNAGIVGATGAGWKIDPLRVEKNFKINVLSHCWTLQEFLPIMIRQGRGHIVTTSSVIGLVYTHTGSLYIASKHALTAYMECIREDVRKFGGENKSAIHLTTVFPSYTETALMDQGRPMIKNYPFLIPRYSAEEVAKRVLNGVLANEEHIYIPWFTRFFPFLIGIVPSDVYRKMLDLFGADYELNSSISDSKDD